MKTFEEVIESYVAEYYFDFRKLKPETQPKYWEKMAKIYAKQIAQDALNRDAENADTKNVIIADDYGCFEEKIVDKQSITETEIILP